MELVLAAVTRANTISEFFFGLPNQYTVFYDGFGSWLHPHNIFVSIYSFLGFFSFTVFMLFFSLLILSFYKLGKMKFVKVDLDLNVDLLLVCFFYAISSGEFTRTWLLYFFLGIFAAVTSQNKGKQKEI